MNDLLMLMLFITGVVLFTGAFILWLEFYDSKKKKHS